MTNVSDIAAMFFLLFTFKLEFALQHFLKIVPIFLDLWNLFLENAEKQLKQSIETTPREAPLHSAMLKDPKAHSCSKIQKKLASRLCYTHHQEWGKLE